MKPEIERIETEDLLEACAAHLAGEKQLAVDMEADSMFHYHEKVCLVQIATVHRTFVVDPLAIGHLDPLRPVFADPQIRKIFHGADYDIRSLYRDFHVEVQNLFDTELACRFLGHEKTGLDAVLKQYFGVELDKKYQKRDWSARPLSPEMIAYAARDTTYLIRLGEILQTALSRKGRLEWVREECETLSQVRAHPKEAAPLFLKFKGAGKLRPRSLAVLEAVLIWRDQLAQKRDRPPFKVLGNREILGIVEAMPTRTPALEATGILSRRQFQMYGEEIVEAVQSALEIPAGALPVYPGVKRRAAPDAWTQRRIEALKKWRDRKAEELSMDAAIILNKEAMTAVAAARQPHLGNDTMEQALKKWQLRAFARDLSRVLAACDGR